MKRLIYFMMPILLLLIIYTNSLAEWTPTNGHKMHFPQLPNTGGWAVRATDQVIMADDWQCTETSIIKDIHFWGGWLNDVSSTINSFTITVLADHPDISNLPGDILIQLEMPIDAFEITSLYEPEWLGWYDPDLGYFIDSNHQTYYQYDLYLPDSLFFIQKAGETYWLSIEANVDDTLLWGWQSSSDKNSNKAVWSWDETISFWMQSNEPGNCYGYTPGDIDNDGDIDFNDLYYLTNPTSPPPTVSECPACDVNGDCTINITDATALSGYINGGPELSYCPTYPPCQPLSLAFVVNGNMDNCCMDVRGNIDFDYMDNCNIVDLTYLVAYLFGGGPPPPCWEEGNVNGDPAEAINIVDLTYLVNYLFGDGPPPSPCP